MSRRARILVLQIAAPVLAVLFGVLASSVIILAIHQNPLSIFALIVTFNLRLSSVASILTSATPLIFAGLATAIGFRVNIFNIGVEGQYYVGGFLAALASFAVSGLPGILHVPLVVLTAIVGGMAWAWLPAYLRKRRGAHEVITTIMMNYIAFNLILYFLTLVRDRHLGSTARIRTPLFSPSALIPHLAPPLNALGLHLPLYSPLNWFLVIAVLLAVGAWFWLRRSRFGYETKAVAFNPAAAEAGGIKVARVQFVMFILSGAIAGLVGLSDMLGRTGYFDIDFPKGLGFLGISVALLARNDPLGIIAAALLFGYLDRGAQGIQAFASVPREVITILQALIILAIVVVYELATRYIRILRKQEAV
ncbi:MAG TPA: ABC transporter permease [Candidatus Dormibacteraeota bacterium]|nr:ABC transporter permease [Candidatus Dormibacteraeota bacterium]